MGNYFDAIAKIESLISQFESIVTGADTAEIQTSGGLKPSVQKAVADRLEYLKALVQGSLAFATYADMLLDTTQSPNTLARVWNDPTRNINGVYGWDGTAWTRSPLDATFDVYAELESVFFTAPALAARRLMDAGIAEYFSTPDEDIFPVVVAEDTNQALLAFDKLGRAILDLHPEVTQRIAKDFSSKYEIVYVEPESHSKDILFAVTDDAPRQNVLAMVDNKGKWHFSGQNSDYGVNLINRPVLYHIINDGQSQSTGATASPPLTVSFNTTNTPLMPSTGLTSLDFSELADFTEFDDAYETPAGGLIDGLINNLKSSGLDFDNAKFKFALSCPGVGGTQIERYIEGGTQANRFISQVVSMQKAAFACDLDYQLHGYTWTLGGTDMGTGTSYQDYYDNFIAMHNWREATVREKLGRPALELNCFVWQNGARSWVDNIDVGNAQVQAAKDHDRIHMVCPYYQFEFNDGVHLTNTSSKLLGYYMQRAYKTVVIDEKSWEPLWLLSAKASGQIITLDFNVPHPPLEFDTDRLTPISNQGFHVVDDQGDLVITNVQIINGVSVQITIDRPLDVNPKIGYAIKYNNDGAAQNGNHPRGHLRDSAGYTEKYIEPAVLVNSTPLEIPVHNWCLTFLEPLEIV